MSMKNGILLYTPEDAARNQWFIEQLIHYAESEGMSLRLCLSDLRAPHFLIPYGTDYIINRSRLYKYSSYAEEIMKPPVPCFNSRFVTGVTNQKYMTYCILNGEYGIPMAETWEFRKREPLPALQFPLVAKPADGHGGEGVAWLETEAALEQYAADFDAAHPEPTYPFLLQKPAVTGWDVRIYILGGEIYSAVLRTSDSDFRSNFSLGGKAEVIEPDADMRALVERILTVMPMDFAGIDLLRSPEGGYLLGEIEDAVGCRMLYQLTDLNPARDYMHYIRRRLS